MTVVNAPVLWRSAGCTMGHERWWWINHEWQTILPYTTTIFLLRENFLYTWHGSYDTWRMKICSLAITWKFVVQIFNLEVFFWKSYFENFNFGFMNVLKSDEYWINACAYATLMNQAHWSKACYGYTIWGPISWDSHSTLLGHVKTYPGNLMSLEKAYILRTPSCATWTPLGGVPLALYVANFLHTTPTYRSWFPAWQEMSIAKRFVDENEVVLWSEQTTKNRFMLLELDHVYPNYLVCTHAWNPSLQRVNAGTYGIMMTTSFIYMRRPDNEVLKGEVEGRSSELCAVSCFLSAWWTVASLTGRRWICIILKSINEYGSYILWWTWPMLCTLTMWTLNKAWMGLVEKLFLNGLKD